MVGSQAAQRYGVDISSRRQLNELQRLEQSHGRTVYDWLNEGMPREAMGTPRDMRAFRKRKNTPVPWDVEAQNDQSVQRSATAATDTGPAGGTSVPDAVRAVISSSGHSLDGSVKRLMETDLGGSFGDVQVHTGPKAAAACESITARAFTVGNHIAFNHGEYDPSSPGGQHVIAHELAHVRQQTGGAVSLLAQNRPELEFEPDPQSARQAQATTHRVMEGGRLGIQRLKDTDVHVQQSTQLPIGNPQMPSGFRSVVDSPQEVEARKNRLQGRKTDGTAMQAAVQQRGPSCLLAMLQAYLITQQRDTTSLGQIIRNYPREIETGSALDDRNVNIRDFIRKNPLGFSSETQSYITETVDHLERTAESIPNQGWQGRFQSKGIACALGKIYQTKRKNGELATPEQQQNDETLTTGKNLLKRAQKGSLALYPMVNMMNNNFSDSMDGLKERFMKFVSKNKSPMLVSGSGYYNPDFPEDNPIEDERPGHVLLMYGVWMDENDNVFVSFRNGRDNDGVTRDLELNKFLAPIHRGTVEALKNKNSYCRDVDKITPRIVLAPLSIDRENAHEQISKPIDPGDESDSDYYSVTEDESELPSESLPEFVTEAVVRQFCQLVSS